MLAASRRAAVPFDVAWKKALRRVAWPHDTEHRRAWHRVLVETRDAWRAAYEREPDEHYALATEALDPVA